MDDIRQTWTFLEEMMHDELKLARFRGELLIRHQAA
jgi:hypothetical protein